MVAGRTEDASPDPSWGHVACRGEGSWEGRAGNLEGPRRAQTARKPQLTPDLSVWLWAWGDGALMSLHPRPQGWASMTQSHGVTDSERRKQANSGGGWLRPLAGAEARGQEGLTPSSLEVSPRASIRHHGVECRSMASQYVCPWALGPHPCPASLASTVLAHVTSPNPQPHPITRKPGVFGPPQS